MLMAIPWKPVVAWRGVAMSTETSYHTKTKGDLGVLKAQVDLFEQDFGSSASLRVETPKNGQAKHVNRAADFRRAP
jgi:hypothetical protein